MHVCTCTMYIHALACVFGLLQVSDELHCTDVVFSVGRVPCCAGSLSELNLVIDGSPPWIQV